MGAWALVEMMQADEDEVSFGELEAWRAALQRRFPGIQTVAAQAQGVDGQLVSRRLGDRWMWQVRSGPQQLSHQAHRSYDPIALLVQLDGEAAVSQRGATCELGPGSFMFIDTMAPTQMEVTSRGAQQFIELPARFGAVGALLASAPRVLRADCPADAPLLGLITQLWTSAPLLDEAQQHHALSALDALARVTSAAQRGAAQVSDHARFERAVATIAARLADPQLDAAQVAASQRISRRSLDAIFAAQGWTVTRWIWEQRLLGAAEALRAPGGPQRSALDVALAHGFLSASHFSRAFKARFGASPSAWRAGASIVSDLDTRCR